MRDRVFADPYSGQRSAHHVEGGRMRTIKHAMGLEGISLTETRSSNRTEISRSRPCPHALDMSVDLITWLGSMRLPGPECPRGASAQCRWGRYSPRTRAVAKPVGAR